MNYNYESPIEIYVDDIISDWKLEQENNVINVIRKYGITVDKDELVKALNYDRQQYEKGFNHGYNISKWKNIEERLPLEDEQVLVCNKYGRCETARYSSCWKKVWELADKRYFLEDFPYWQPLPEPPEELSK